MLMAEDLKISMVKWNLWETLNPWIISDAGGTMFVCTRERNIMQFALQ